MNTACTGGGRELRDESDRLIEGHLGRGCSEEEILYSGYFRGVKFL